MNDEDNLPPLRRGDDSPETSDPPSDGDTRDTVWAFIGSDLALADYYGMLWQAEASRHFAQELRDIVRGTHPYTADD